MRAGEQVEIKEKAKLLSDSLFFPMLLHRLFSYRAGGVA